MSTQNTPPPPGTGFRTDSPALMRTLSRLGGGWDFGDGRGTVGNIYGGQGTARDPMSGTFIKDSPVLSDRECEALIKARIPRRVVETYPLEAPQPEFIFGKKYRSYGTGNDELTAYLDTLGWMEHLTTAAIASRLYGDGYVLIGVDDGSDWDEPLNEGRVKSIRWLKPLYHYEIRPYNYAENPAYYELSRYSGPEYDEGDGVTDLDEVPKAQKIHRSRLLRFRGDRLIGEALRMNAGRNLSALQALVNSYTRAEQALSSANYLIKTASVFSYGLAGLAQLIGDPTGAGAEDVYNRLMAVMMSLDVMSGIPHDSEQETLGFASRQMGGVKDILEVIIDQIAVDSDMPRFKLLGQPARAGLGNEGRGESDRYEWAQRVAAWCQRNLKDPVQYLGRVALLAKNGPSRGRIPEGYGVKFPSILSYTPGEELEMRAKHADTVNTLINASVLDAEEVRESTYGGAKWSYEITLQQREEPPKRPAPTLAAASPDEEEPESIQLDAAPLTPAFILTEALDSAYDDGIDRLIPAPARNNNWLYKDGRFSGQFEDEGELFDWAIERQRGRWVALIVEAKANLDEFRVDWREDRGIPAIAPGKKAKKKRNCTPKSKSCGGSCINRNYTCRVDLLEKQQARINSLEAQIKALQAQLDKEKNKPAVLPGGVAELKPSDIAVDPKRFQYKILGEATASGEVGSLSGVRKWDPNLAGIVQVWRDPADGKTWVVNGHNRLALAQRVGAETITVRYLDAKTATEARAIGALSNIAESKGTALDAAKFLRDTGISREDLAAKGIPMREKIAQDGLNLSKLDDSVFRRVIDGEMSQERGAIIGGSGLDKVNQRSLVQLIDQREKSGKLTNETIRELAESVRASTQRTETQIDLFGTSTTTKSNAIERAQLSAYVKQRLSREKKLFGTVSTTRAAGELSAAGNVINREQSRSQSERAATALNVFDQMKNMSGGISQALNQGADRLVSGEGLKRIQDETYRSVLAEVQSLTKTAMDVPTDALPDNIIQAGLF